MPGVRLVASSYLATIPTYASVSTTIDSDGRRWHSAGGATLAEVNGARVYVELVLLVCVAALLLAFVVLG